MKKIIINEVMTIDHILLLLLLLLLFQRDKLIIILIFLWDFIALFLID